jgi:hypothetical protein
MCLRFMFLLITRLAAWLRLARREETWKTGQHAGLAGNRTSGRHSPDMRRDRRAHTRSGAQRRRRRDEIRWLREPGMASCTAWAGMTAMHAVPLDDPAQTGLARILASRGGQSRFRARLTGR